MLTIKGKTTDDKLVVAGIFRLYESKGVDLNMILDGLHANKHMPCWQTFYDECESAKMNRGKIIPMIVLACMYSAYGPELANIVKERLEEYEKRT